MSSPPVYSVGEGGAVGVGIRNFSACGRGTTLANVIPTVNPKTKVLPEQLAKPVCNCFRHPTQVICRTCGLMFHGRSRMICPQHPQVIHLMDSDKCPKCHSNSLKEFMSKSVPRPRESADGGDRWD